MRGSTPHGELGAEGEAEAEREERRRAARPSMIGGDIDAECVGESRPAKVVRPSRSGDGSLNPKRSPDDEVIGRNGREFRDAIVGEDVNADWSRFDIQRVLRVLRLGNRAQCGLTMRKLHIR